MLALGSVLFITKYTFSNNFIYITVILNIIFFILNTSYLYYSFTAELLSSINA